MASLEKPGIPPHKLMLKVGSVAMVVRNFNPAQHILNGTRVVITHIAMHCVVVARTLDGNNRTVHFPRITFSIMPVTGLTVMRRQFRKGGAHNPSSDSDEEIEYV